MIFAAVNTIWRQSIKSNHFYKLFFFKFCILFNFFAYVIIALCMRIKIIESYVIVKISYAVNARNFIII